MCGAYDRMVSRLTVSLAELSNSVSFTKAAPEEGTEAKASLPGLAETELAGGGRPVETSVVIHSVRHETARGGAFRIQGLFGHPAVIYGP